MKNKNNWKPRSQQDLESLYEDREWTLNAFKSGIFPIKPTQGKGRPLELACIAKFSDLLHLKIQTPKQMLQRVPIALAQVKAGNTSQKVLNEILQIIYSLYWPKEITKKSI